MQRSLQSLIFAKSWESSVRWPMSWGKGGEGAIELAEKVSAVVVERKNRFKPLYQMDWSIEKKIETVAKKSMAPKP